MACEPADAARPVSVLGLVMMPTTRTPARCSSFGASEAQDVSSFRFVGEVVDVFAILPTSHPLVVMASPIFLPDTLRIPDEERPDPPLHTESDDLACGFMPQITDTALGAVTLLVLGTLQLLPATGILLAPILLPGKLPQLLRTLPFERADLSSGDDQGLAGRRRDRCHVVG